MRRNTVTLLKYAIILIGFIILGPMSLKYFLRDTSGELRMDNVGRGLPHDPDSRRKTTPVLVNNVAVEGINRHIDVEVSILNE